MLKMKYFVLKPKAKHRKDKFASASQTAMLSFANMIEDTDSELAESLKEWALKERLAQAELKE